MEEPTAGRWLRPATAWALAAVGLAAWAAGRSMGNPLGQPIGPGYVPAVLGMSLAVLGAVDGSLGLWEKLRGNRVAAPGAGPGRTTTGPAPGGRALRQALLLAWLLAGLGLWARAGYLAGSVTMLLGVWWTDRRTPARFGIPFSLLVSIGVWLLFEKALKVHLG